MRVMDVLGVRVEMPTNQPIVLLRERDGGRGLPIWIGAAEASAIAYAQQGIVPPRPLTHDLLMSVIEGLGHRLAGVRIVELKDRVYYAELDLTSTEGEGSTVAIESRTSDAIALALRAGVEISADDDILAEAGVELPDETSEAEDEVERFKEFLDQVSPEDFGAEEPGP